MNSRKIIWYGTALLVLAAIYFGRVAYNAHLNLVTLDVRDLPVRDVVKKMEHQTWEVIYVDKAVEGKVTMQVEKMPLEEALRLVGGQIMARAATIYPLYSTSQSFTALKKSLRGEVDPATHGWTNLQSRNMAFGGFGGMGGGRGGMGGMMAAMTGGAAQNQLVSLSISAKDVAFASLALNRFASARVVPEDGVNSTISFIVKNATVPETVAKLAKAANRNWTTIYALQSFGGPGGPGGRGGFAGFGSSGPGGPGGPPPSGEGNTNTPPRRGGPGGPEMTDEQRAEATKQRAAIEQELLATLPTEERQKIEDAQAERDKLMQEMANMTDEQRRDRMMQMMGPGMDKMMRERLLNSTPEQRARMRGPGGPGGGGGRGGPGGPGR